MNMPISPQCRLEGARPAAGRTPCSLALIALTLAPLAALADLGNAKTIASGLANPRGIAFAPNGALYVAENGTGGTGPCVPSPPMPQVNRCYGETGAISQILPNGAIRRIATGLPSLALPNGTAEGGPAQLAFHGMTAYVNISLGGDPRDVRSALSAGGARQANLFGQMLRVTPSGQYQVVSDVAQHEVAANPGGGAVDSNPYGLAALPGRRIVADAGANAIFEVLANGTTRTFSVPPALPGGRESVPTSVVEGPDGALYVGLLTGGPFFTGTASVLRMEPDGSATTTYATGFTAIVGVAFDTGGALYVLETASGFPTGGPPPTPGLGAGRLKRQCPGGTPGVLLDGLTFPGGVAIGPDGAAYVTNFGTSATMGEVLRLPLTPCS